MRNPTGYFKGFGDIIINCNKEVKEEIQLKQSVLRNVNMEEMRKTFVAVLRAIKAAIPIAALSVFHNNSGSNNYLYVKGVACSDEPKEKHQTLQLP